MISLVMCTYRPGGIDILAYCLAEAPEADYELVIVDDFPGRVERNAVPEYLRMNKVKLGWYGKSKPKSCPNAKGGLCNAWNTALMHAKGDYTVFLSDFSWLPVCWAAQWGYLKETFAKNCLVSGGAIVYQAPKPTISEDVRTWNESVAPMPRSPWVPRDWENFYWGCHWDYWEASNGMDERADHCHCWPVSSQVKQAGLLGYKLQVCPEVACHMVDHRVWDTPEEKAPDGCGMDGLWKIDGGLQSLVEEPDWQARSPNPFDLAEERRKNLA